MLLLDRIVSRGEQTLEAEVVIGDGSLFLEPEGVPSYAGLEYMAQACGAYAGAVSLDAGEPIRIGYLLGVRNFMAAVPFFRVGECLSVAVVLRQREEGFGFFDCRIDARGALLASANLIVYQSTGASGQATGEGT
jgi:predicted hotdog family 3-hydroxylacyl-ACP dehydratase